MMDWIKNFDVFLFDFDGLLVNTEQLHYNAYKKMLFERGHELHWDFGRYCEFAHYDSASLRNQVKTEFPELFQTEPSWEVLYKEKQAAVLEQIIEGETSLMPGAEELLKALGAANKKMAVVTHSPTTLINLIRFQNPILDTIPLWITREDYTHPKPDPECYNLAISKLKVGEEKVAGFEDTPRGLKALMQTEATPFLIATVDYPEIPLFKAHGAHHFPDFYSINLA